MPTSLASAPPDKPMLWFNGVDGRKRRLSDAAGAAAARRRPGARRPRGTGRASASSRPGCARLAGKARRGLKEGLDPGKLEEAGWGVIFPRSGGLEPLREALRSRSLLAGCGRDRPDASSGNSRATTAIRDGETKVAFLARHGAGPGPADPEKVPYYLLLVGDPEAIPFSFQYQLDVQYAVGRLCFDDLEEYRRYAESVVAAEARRGTGGIGRRPWACVLRSRQPGRPGDRIDQRPPGRSRSRPGWRATCPAGASRPRSARRRPGPARRPARGGAPALLFAACHGLGFAAGDPVQRDRQGALVCQDWPGPGPGGIDREHYFAAEDVAEHADVHGLVAFCFACFGAGTPRWDDFTRRARAASAPSAASRRRFVGPPAAAAARAIRGAARWRWSATSSAPGASPWCGPAPGRRSPPSRAPSGACSTGSRWAGRWRSSISGTPSSPPTWRRKWRLWSSARSSTRRCSPTSGPPATMPATTRSSAIPRCGSRQARVRRPAAGGN